MINIKLIWIFFNKFWKTHEIFNCYWIDFIECVTRGYQVKFFLTYVFVKKKPLSNKHNSRKTLRMNI